MQQICAVPGCTNSETDEFLKFYALPYNDKEVCKEWIRRIGNHKLYIQHVNVGPPVYKICEIHFNYVCKTEVNSGLHEGSLPTLYLPSFYLPTVKNVRPPTNSFFPSTGPSTEALTDKSLTKIKEDKFYLQVEMCSYLCRFCYRKGILYDIQNSVYNKDTEFAAIIKSIIPEYVMNSSEVRESFCLNCIKEVLTCYLTTIRIENAMKVFSFLVEPLKDKKLANRVVYFTRPNDLDMKTILQRCKLEISAGSIKTKFCKEDFKCSLKQKNVSIPSESVEVPRPILEIVKIDVDALPNATYTNKLPSELTETPKELLNDTFYTSKELSNMKNTSSQILKNSTSTPSKILNMTLKSKTVLKCPFNDTTSKCNDKEETINSKQSVKIVKLPNHTSVESPMSSESSKVAEIPTKEFSSSINKELQTIALKKINLKQNPKLSNVTRVLNQTPNVTKVTSVTETSRKYVRRVGRPPRIEISSEVPKVLDSPNQHFIKNPSDKQYANKRKLANLELSGVDRKSAVVDIIINEVKMEGNDNFDLPKTINTDLTKSNKHALVSSESEISIKMEDSTSQQVDETLLREDFEDIEDFTQPGIDYEDMDTAFHAFRCGMARCTFTCETLVQYSAHLQMRHRTVRRCIYCGAAYANATDYELHVKTHKKPRTRKRTKRKVVEKPHECAHCAKVYYTRDVFLKHLRMKHGKMINCPICAKQISVHNLSNHKERHNNKTKCIDCKSQFDSVILLQKHELEQHPKVCLICSKTFGKLAGIRLHMKSHITIKGNLTKCKFCHKKLRSKKGLVRHLQYREKYQMCYSEKRKLKLADRIVCVICGKCVARQRIALHMRVAHSQSRRFSCDRCSYRSHIKRLMVRHQLTHFGDKPFLCTECGRAFIQKNVFVSHMNMHVILPQPKPCRYCEETFKTKHDHRVHSQRHGLQLHRKHRKNRYVLKDDDGQCKDESAIDVSGAKVECSPLMRKHKCIQCDKMFGNDWKLRTHIAAVHADNPTLFQCHFCNKGFDTYNKVQGHTMKEHRKRPDCVCNICQKVCLSTTHLEFHMNSHTGERPYKCDICPARFRAPGHVTTHKTAIHEDRRPFPCKLCNKAFRTKPALKEHIRTHTGERLKCAHCDKTFAGNSNRCKHMREVHNIRSIPIYTKCS